MTHDNAYWNMHRVLERILLFCDSNVSLSAALPATPPFPSSGEVRIRQTSIMTPGGKTIRIIRKPPNLMG